jgi:hypothetical protein
MCDSPILLALKLAERTVNNTLNLSPSKCQTVLSEMRLHLPYVWWGDATLLLCGREYQPVGGAGVCASWREQDFSHLTIDRALIAGIPGMLRQKGASAWFYHDGNSPWRSKAYAKAYLELLRVNIETLTKIWEEK